MELKTTTQNLLEKLKSEDKTFNINSVIREIEILIENATEMSQGVKNKPKRAGKHRHKYSKTKKNKEPWYNMDSHILIRNLGYTCKALSKDPQNSVIRNTFYKLRKEYRRLKKFLKKSYEQKIMMDLEGCSNQGKEFWKKVQSLRETKKASPYRIRQCSKITSP